MSDEPAIPRPALIHVVDDEPGICRALDRFLGRDGHTVETFARAEDSLAQAERATPDLVILDVRLPGMTGLEALERFVEFSAPPSVLMVTAHGTLDIAVEALRRGAADYLPKPLDLDRIGAVVARVLEQRQQVAAVAPSTDGGRRPLLVGRSAEMQDLFKQIATVAMSDVPVLVLGESGTGKEGVARAIHGASAFSGGPFEAVDCASLPESLFEGELFGHERGAFTGAVQQRIGRLERADGGTLFLDEVAEIPPATQAKLLRFLEERTFERLGGRGPLQVNARILAATHRDLAERMAAGLFREDLFYRLDVVTLRVPPLRERLEDIPILVAHFLGDPRVGRTAGITAAALDRLLGHTWPGNVRELRNAVDHARVLSRGTTIAPEHLPAGLSGRDTATGSPGPDDAMLRAWVRRLIDDAGDGATDLHPQLVALLERPLLEEVLERTGGNQVQAAKRLGIHRTTLRERMQRYDIGR